MNHEFKHFKTLLLENGILLIGFDYEGSSVNINNDESLEELEKLVQFALENKDVKGAVLLSLKQGNFCAGADLKKISLLRQNNQLDLAEGIISGMHVLLQKIEQSPKPFVAAIGGAALGGGLELALACRSRIVSDNPKTALALPEVKLGIIPGFGGTQRLRRIIGIPAALEMITSGKSVYARPAFKLGLADKCVTSVPSEIRTLEEISKERLSIVAINHALDLCRKKRMERKFGTSHTLLKFPGIRNVVFFGARLKVRQKTKGRYPAPERALDAVKQGMKMSAYRASQNVEKPIFMKCLRSQLSGDLMNFFFWQERAEKIMPIVPTPEKIGVIGAGKMGWQIAALLAQKGKQVVLKDVNQNILARAIGKISDAERTLLLKKIIKPHEYQERMLAVYPTIHMDRLSGVGFAMEAALERLEVKRKILEEFEEIASPDATFATNTSSYTVAEIAKNAKHPERCVGLHFFNPVSKMRLVEVVRASFSSEASVRAAFSLARELGRIPIIVKDGPGFLVNRILSRYVVEAVWLAAQGVKISRIDGAAKVFGMAIDSGRAMGPLELIDFVGIQVAVEVVKSLQSLGSRFEVPHYLVRMAPEEKHPLTFWKAGTENPETVKLIREHYVQGEIKISDDMIEKRLIFPMVDEAFRCLEDGIVNEPWQIDLAMLHGAGFPAFRGGLMTWAEREGMYRIAKELKFLEDAHSKRFASCDSLLRLFL